MARTVFPSSDWDVVQGDDTVMEPYEPFVTEDRSFRDSGAAAAGPFFHEDDRARAVSASLPWRRPKSAMFAHDNIQAFSQRMDDCAIDELSETAGSARPSTRSQSHGASGSFKGLFRRASVSLKGMIHRRPSISTEKTIYEDRPRSPRPMTAQSTWNRLRRATSFRHPPSVYDIDPAYKPFQISQQYAHSSYLPVPGLGHEPPVIPRNTGAAAKASAAMQNEYLARQGLQNRWLHATASEDGNDRESGIGISVTLSGTSEEAAGIEALDAEDGHISRIDFVTRLPSELAIHVLAYLDAAALAHVSAVSCSWRKVAADQHIWRESCLREMASTYATSGAIQPNTGRGIPKVLPSSDWKQIYRARKELNQRWKTGKARPVYLNGHTDSIYCLQFDE